MDKLDAALTGGRDAQLSVIGSMLIDDRCVPLVLRKLRPEDFVDGTCRSTFKAIQKLAREGRPVDVLTVLDAMQGGDKYTDWMWKVHDRTPTAANVEEYIGIARRSSTLYRLREMADKMLLCTQLEDAEALVRKMSLILSATDRMPRMTGPELAADFLARMRSDEKPEYLPWGLPTADRSVYAELGDMILLGGYASSGKTLLSILMAMTQAKRGYKVGYYSLETRPEKMADRMFASLTKVPLNRIKTRNFAGGDWAKFAEAANYVASVCPYDIMRAAGSTVDDVISDAIGHGYQVVYVDYVQLLRAPGVRDSDGYSRITAASQALKTFAQNANTAVVALAQLTRPPGTEPKKEQNEGDPEMPTMHSFKGSGQLEQDADAAFLVIPEIRKNNKSRRIFKVVKNKEGEQSDPVLLDFDGSTQTMVELGSKGISMEDWVAMDQMEIGDEEDDSPFADSKK